MARSRLGVVGNWSPSPKDDQYRAKLKSLLKVQENGCWEYQGWCNEWGYGTMGYCGDTWMVPRLAYVLWKGPIPVGHYICHTCDNPPCGNPSHLWPGKSRENLKDCVSKGRHAQASQTACVHGHEFTPENIRWHFEIKTGKLKRHCKACELARCRIRQGWPEELAYDDSFRVPAGYRLDLETRQIVPGRGRQRLPSRT